MKAPYNYKVKLTIFPASDFHRQLDGEIQKTPLEGPYIKEEDGQARQVQAHLYTTLHLHQKRYSVRPVTTLLPFTFHQRSALTSWQLFWFGEEPYPSPLRLAFKHHEDKAMHVEIPPSIVFLS